jgi:hypothetical protein
MKIFSLVFAVSISSLVETATGDAPDYLFKGHQAEKDDLISNLVDSTTVVVLSDTKLTGNATCAGVFNGGEDVGIDDFPTTGVVLSTGDVTTIDAPNDNPDTSTTYRSPGDSDLNGLLPGQSEETHDACLLEFNFKCAPEISNPWITFNYVFASDEYNEWVNREFNDVFGLFLNGENIALVPGSNVPVTIKSVNRNVNNDYYFDNYDGVFRIEADGLTK